MTKGFKLDDVVYSSLERTKAEGIKSFQVSWSVNTFGFGLFYFYTEEDKIHCDTETLGRKSLSIIMDKFITGIHFIKGREQDINCIGDLEIIAIEKGEDDWRMECLNTTKEKAISFLTKMISECTID